MKISRRKFLTTGIAAGAGLGGLALAAKLAQRYGLVPPDAGGIYGPGETLTYATQRLFARHSLAREFPRSMISKVPFANEISPLNDAFKKLQAGGFADWKLSITGMVERPASYSLADLKTFRVRSQITEIVCEEGWSYVAEHRYGGCSASADPARLGDERWRPAGRVRWPAAVARAPPAWLQER